jgi:hypothetical protein
MIGRWPLIAANLVCLGMAALVLALRIRYAHRSNRPRGA